MQQQNLIIKLNAEAVSADCCIKGAPSEHRLETMEAADAAGCASSLLRVTSAAVPFGTVRSTS